ncbi:MAG TPA: acyltransferase [Bryobacteraceae bacterium]|jgi:peptidoglycan/LPS O-acetylase OafA/YrhL|nr:acyltransferase [Bryobacteraceae bacterium]
MKRIPELDGLRGIAIILVLLFHFGPVRGPLGFLAPFFQTGWIGVDLFFVLSGFLITGILLDARGRAGAYRNFIIRRTLRIFPMYYAVLLLDGYLSFYPGPVEWASVPARVDWWYFTYLSDVKVFLDNKWPVLGTLIPLWSLSVEEQFYLLFPLAVLFLSRKSLTRMLLAALVAAVAIRAGMVVAMPANITGTYTLMPCRMDALALGGLIAIAHRDYPEMLGQRWIAWLTVVCGIGFVSICMTVSTGPRSNPMRTVGFMALDTGFAGLLVLLLKGASSLVALCRLRILVWMGTISYGIYLLHIPVAVIARRHEGTSVKLGGSADFVISVCVSLAAAWVSWTVFESPILRLKNRFAPR